MWFRKILLGMLALWLGLMGMAFGALFVFCAGVYLLWHGLSVSVIMFGTLCMVFVVLACVVWRRMAEKDKMRLAGHDPVLLAQGASYFPESGSEKERESLERHKTL